MNHASKPSELKITDIRFADIVDAPMHCTLLRIDTNQGISGFGEVRDGASRTFAAMLKGRLLGENPCDVDRLFRRIRQFGGHARQAGGVCGIEVALWDLAGKAHGVPVYQLLGGKFRDKIRVYCDTDIEGKNTGAAMGAALKRRMGLGYTFLKMDLGAHLMFDIPGAIAAPPGFLEQFRDAWDNYPPNIPVVADESLRARRNRWYDILNTMHPMACLHFTKKGLDWLENYVAEVRGVIGDEIPLSLDHIGHVAQEDAINLCRRIEKYNITWIEDVVPWHLVNQYKRIAGQTSVPLATGEDIYLKENFLPLLESGALSVVHPDVLSAGGILETKKVGDLAQRYGVAMGLHMAESPIGFLAAAHCAAASENFLALEFHSTDVPWWDDIVTGTDRPLVKNGFHAVCEKPGLGIDGINDEVIRAHLHPAYPEIWQSTEQWDNEYCHDRVWS